MAIEISVNEQGKKRKIDWSIWERIVDTRLKNFQDSFPTIINLDIIDPETSALTPSQKN